MKSLARRFAEDAFLLRVLLAFGLIGLVLFVRLYDRAFPEASIDFAVGRP